MTFADDDLYPTAVAFKATGSIVEARIAVGFGFSKSAVCGRQDEWREFRRTWADHAIDRTERTLQILCGNRLRGERIDDLVDATVGSLCDSVDVVFDPTVEDSRDLAPEWFETPNEKLGTQHNLP